MPNWLIILIVLIAVVPGAVVVLMGVTAMFFMPTGTPERDAVGFEVVQSTEADKGQGSSQG